jgi:hypothetical protein
MTTIDDTNTLDLVQYQGDSFTLDIEELDSANVPVTFVGATFRLQIGGTPAAPTITESTSGVSITNGGALGTAAIVVSYTAMSALATGDHDMALEVTYATGIRRTLFTGVLTLIEDVRT